MSTTNNPPGKSVRPVVGVNDLAKRLVRPNSCMAWATVLRQADQVGTVL